MRSVNARVYFELLGRVPKEHKNVKLTLELGWITLEDEYGDRTIYPAHVVSSIDAKPTSYDRGS